MNAINESAPNKHIQNESAESQVEPIVMLPDNDLDNELVRFLIIPTIQKMKKIDVIDLRIKIENGKWKFLMIPAI